MSPCLHRPCLPAEWSSWLLIRAFHLQWWKFLGRGVVFKVWPEKTGQFKILYPVSVWKPFMNGIELGVLVHTCYPSTWEAGDYKLEGSLGYILSLSQK